MSFKPVLFSAVSLMALSQGVAVSSAYADTAPSLSDEATVVIVKADPLRRSSEDVISNTAVLRGSRLAHQRQSTLGESLNGLPGVQSETFGGGASRPVIRGQTAPRVKVLSDGAGLMDASEVSPDHVVSGETLLLESIEVLRGPSALLYGGGAIGGAINLVDRKIPTQLPEKGFEGEGELRFGTADDERAGVIGATFGAGNFAFRLEGAQWDISDYRVPFYTPPHHEHDDEHGDEDDHNHDHEEGFKRVVGSFNKTRTYTVGGSWIGSRGYLGAAYTEKRSEYGLPGHSHEYEDCHPHGSSLHCGGHGHEDEDHDHEHEEHDHEHVASVDLISKRVDIRGEWLNPFAGFERLRLRGGFTDYRHDELDDGKVNTFTNKGHDVRIEAQHSPIGNLRGVMGIQTSHSDFATSGTGSETFIPPSETRNTALFVMEEYVHGNWRFEGALRQEWQKASAIGRADTEHNPFSASASASWTFTPGYVLSLVLGRSQRAPHVQELYARGVHLATNTYEVGNGALSEETARSAELTFKKTSGDTTFSISAYSYDYDGYIYAHTLDQKGDFRLIQYRQQDARFSGFDGFVRHRFGPGLSVTVFGDSVRAELNNGEPLPRIAPARLGARLDGRRGDVSGNLEFIRVAKQDRISDYETATPGYDMLNATLAYDLGGGNGRTQVFLRGTNLLDQVVLNHTSFLSTVAPLRGRNVVMGVRTRF